MLNPFPELLTYSTFGPFILRLVIGLIFLNLGVLKFRGEKKRWLTSLEALAIKPADVILSIYAVIQVVGGLMLILGLYTQIAALVFVVLTGIEFYIEWMEKTILKRDIVFYLLTLAIACSLLLTGAGAFAFDIPL
jgi:putative oxidoreductase